MNIALKEQPSGTQSEDNRMSQAFHRFASVAGATLVTSTITVCVVAGGAWSALPFVLYSTACLAFSRFVEIERKVTTALLSSGAIASGVSFGGTKLILTFSQ